MAELITVHPQETLEGLLTAIAHRLESTPDSTVLLWAPRGTLLLRQMEDYQALREALHRAGTRLKILSPDARIVGMARVFGLEAEITLHAPEDSAAAPPPAPAARPQGRPPTPPVRPAAPRRAPAPPPASPAADWPFNGEVDLPASLVANNANPAAGTAPPDVPSAGLIILPETAPDPAHETVDLSKLPHPLTMARQTVALNALQRDPSAADPGTLPLQLQAAAPGAGPPERVANRLHPDEDDSPAISFAQWLAMQATNQNGELPPDLDLSHFPTWLQSTLAADPPRPLPAGKPMQPARARRGDPPPPAPAAIPPRPTVLRCPHCGGELDQEEMLRLLAELWGR